MPSFLDLLDRKPIIYFTLVYIYFPEQAKLFFFFSFQEGNVPFTIISLDSHGIIYMPGYFVF